MSVSAPVVWSALIGADVAIELVTVALSHKSVNVPNCTLSHATRVLCKTDTSVGKAAFVLGWTALSAWFVPHILSNSSLLSGK